MSERQLGRKSERERIIMILAVEIDRCRLSRCNSSLLLPRSQVLYKLFELFHFKNSDPFELLCI